MELAVRVWLFVLGCSLRPALRDADTAAWERDLDEAIDLCVQDALPNSMAREPGFDMEAWLREIAAQRAVVEARLRDRAAPEWLEAQVRDDELDQICLDRVRANLAAIQGCAASRSMP